MAVALAKQLKCNGFKNFAGLGLEPHHADQQTVLDCVALVDRVDALILSS